VGRRSGLDGVAKIKFLTPPGLELRPLRRPAQSQPLHRLRYLGSIVCKLYSCKYSKYAHNIIHKEKETSAGCIPVLLASVGVLLLLLLLLLIIIIIIILYYLCAASTAVRPITDTAQCTYK
jgi:hypothetical protein